MTYTLSRTTIFTFATLAGALIASNAYAVYQNQQLQSRYETLAGNTLAVALGTVVPPLDGAAADGSPLRLAYDSGKSTLVMVFGPKCVFSNNNWPQWERLLERVDRTRVQIGFVNAASPDTVNEVFVQERHLTTAFVMNTIDPADRMVYRLSLTPQTVVIDASGTVRLVKTGHLDDHSVEEIARLLN